MPAYDHAWFDPPAPLALVTLRNPEGGATVTDVPMLLDSGADVALVPAGVLSSLGLAPLAGTQYELVGFDGGTSRVDAVRLELVFCRRAFRGQFVLIDQSWGVLGRNVLNAIPILLDGPRLRWEELSRSNIR
jgi:hypothetical protein